MKYLIFLITFVPFTSCKQNLSEVKSITNPTDYKLYLNPEFQEQKLNSIDEQIEFWEQKFEQDKRGFSYLNKVAGLYKKKFKLDGEINHAYTSDSLFGSSLKITSGKNKIPAYQGLSQNAILKHQFKKALDYADSAIALSTEPELLLKFDALLELGDSIFSHQVMDSYGYRNDFDFLTRKSKYMDQIGDLDSAIMIMEVAAKRMQNSNNMEMICWSMSNLGDMYMHAGRVKESYNAYLNVLKLEPSYHYALKGIAWLAYSHDDKPRESLTILEFLASQSKMPDPYLMMAEIYKYLGMNALVVEKYRYFYEQASDSRYVDMYNKYKILLNSEQFNESEKAIILSKKEFENRKTPAVYDLLAWSYFMNGELERAYDITNQYVLGKSSEPELLYHSAVILKNKKMNKKANLLFTELKLSQTEIGPLMYSNVLTQME